MLSAEHQSTRLLVPAGRPHRLHMSRSFLDDCKRDSSGVDRVTLVPVANPSLCQDIAVSSGSACTSASLEPSYVLRALGVEEDMAHTSIRFGLGRFTTPEEVRNRPPSRLSVFLPASVTMPAVPIVGDCWRTRPTMSSGTRWTSRAPTVPRPGSPAWMTAPRQRTSSSERGCATSLPLQVDRAVELTVQHVAKLREMSPLWEMVQVRPESHACNICAR